MGGLERLAQLDRDLVERAGDLGRRDPKVVELHAVEPLGERAQGGVAVLVHLCQHGADLVDGRVCLGRGPREPATEVAAAGPTQVESTEHDRQRYPGPLRHPHPYPARPRRGSAAHAR